MAKKILVSACLAGAKCRFDGTSCPDVKVVSLVEAGTAVPGCPEILGGLGVPRPAAEIVGGDGGAVLGGAASVLTAEGLDLTGAYLVGTERFADLARREGCAKAILKSKSPACGGGRIFDGSFSGKVQSGDGVAAAALKLAGVEVETID